MYNNTMDIRCQLIHNEKYCHVIGNNKSFVEPYLIREKYDCHLGLYKFVNEYGVLDKMTYDGSQEQIRRKTKFQRGMRKYEIKGQVNEKNGQTKIQ